MAHSRWVTNVGRSVVRLEFMRKSYPVPCAEGEPAHCRRRAECRMIVGKNACHRNAATTLVPFLARHVSARRYVNKQHARSGATGGSMSGKQLGFIGVG